ncbi:M14 family zinc carboxypeptidase [Dokdonella sp.]|uniref:M14 family zinc carboxypeptidase n=1 Tax=Dokdonella sp. TaxID=2291710 RepID=UPI0025C612B9|nr:M14 family zinc carboxypeptidase [Dokdonella sp.]
MRALRITNLATAAADPDRPKLVAFSSIHAREYAPAELMTRFAEWLVNGYGIDPEATWLVDHNDFRLILQANPDGRKQAETGLSWRKNTNNIDGACGSGNSIGIDLNRNFPFHWNITGGVGSSGNTCSETFRGPLRQSEPETDNLMGYVAGTCNLAGECSGGVFADRRSGSIDPASGNDDGGAAPDDTRGIFFDMHSYSDLVLWSWGDTAALAPNGTQLRTLGRRMAWFNQYDPQPAVELYPTDGTTDDSMYGLLGVPAYTFELDDAFFQSCGSFEGDTLPKTSMPCATPPAHCMRPTCCRKGRTQWSSTPTAPIWLKSVLRWTSARRSTAAASARQPRGTGVSHRQRECLPRPVAVGGKCERHGNDCRRWRLRLKQRDRHAQSRAPRVGVPVVTLSMCRALPPAPDRPVRRMRPTSMSRLPATSRPSAGTVTAQGQRRAACGDCHRIECGNGRDPQC